MPAQIVPNVHGGIVQDVFCSDLKARVVVVVVDWDVEEPGGDGVLEVVDARGQRDLACVQQLQAAALDDLLGTDVARALLAAGIDLHETPLTPTEIP